jgi:hypothetical protein
MPPLSCKQTTECVGTRFIASQCKGDFPPTTTCRVSRSQRPHVPSFITLSLSTMELTIPYDPDEPMKKHSPHMTKYSLRFAATSNNTLHFIHLSPIPRKFLNRRLCLRLGAGALILMGNRWNSHLINRVYYTR